MSSNAVSLRRWQRVEAQITKLGQISISLGSLDGSDTFEPTLKPVSYTHLTLPTTPYV